MIFDDKKSNICCTIVMQCVTAFIMHFYELLIESSRSIFYLLKTTATQTTLQYESNNNKNAILPFSPFIARVGDQMANICTIKWLLKFTQQSTQRDTHCQIISTFNMNRNWMQTWESLQLERTQSMLLYGPWIQWEIVDLSDHSWIDCLHRRTSRQR